MTRPWIRVLKVGGSLLECESLPTLFCTWLAQMDENNTLGASPAPSRCDILIAGGGPLVDQIRRLDQRFALDAETAHWMSVSAMSCTAQLLAHLLGVGQPVCDWQELQSLVTGKHAPQTVFDVQRWLGELEPIQPGVHLSHDWQSTSDSIAARLARVLSADELVLLKSTDCPPGIGWQAAAAQGLVDEHFPRVAMELPQVTWVNLRSA
jgi:aspartokinase-like uncharacterized kinase